VATNLRMSILNIVNKEIEEASGEDVQTVTQVESEDVTM
jgi:hypothetical protein